MIQRIGQSPTSNRLMVLWLNSLILILAMVPGCTERSDWDHQRETIQGHIQAGELLEARQLLLAILPAVQKEPATRAQHAQVMIQLGDIEQREGNYQQAESYFWKALPLIAQSLGPEHVQMADPLARLATLYQQKDQPTIAAPLAKRALAIQEKTWGMSDRRLLPTLKQYQIILMETGNTQQAVTILNRLTQLEQSSF